MKARSDISLECPTALLRAVKTKKNYIHRTSKSDIGLFGGYQKGVLNIRPRNLSDIRRTALCYVGSYYQSSILPSFLVLQAFYADAD
ncbi:hypothetical protein OUZ56_029830 [Daphnia magna]|uniref:Uncharacterized protein n=1 Tax=Daphnia magna TaxID=35525 RepID=A0ABR0B7Z6_9CRUS|nr:hypothetical protein OUZ56_029830 [Daphnia magna]